MDIDENGNNGNGSNGNGSNGNNESDEQFSVPDTPVTLLMACLVDEVVFLPTRSGDYPALVGARFEMPAPLDGREVTLKVAAMVEMQEAGPVRLEFAVLDEQQELLVNAFSDLQLDAGQHLNVTPVRASFDAAGKYILGVAVNGQRAFFPLEVIAEREAVR